MHTFRFSYNGLVRTLKANSEWEAKALFQERWGFWPSEELVLIDQI